MTPLNRLVPALAATIGTLAATTALAHPGHGLGDSLARGLAHPFVGLDHLLAMVGLAAWAVRKDDVRRSAGVFLGALGLGLALGALGLGLPAVELGIAGSVIVFGLLAVAAPRLSEGAALGLVSAFAMLHGQAHGSEVGGLAGSLAVLAGSSVALLGAVKLARLGQRVAVALGASAAFGGVALLAL